MSTEDPVFCSRDVSNTFSSISGALSFSTISFSAYLILQHLNIISSYIGGTLYKPRRTGERKRKSVRGCICGPDLSVIALSILKKGEQEIAGLTDNAKPNRLAKKRRANISAYFNLDKGDDVRRYVNHRTITKGDKTYYKAPRIQRLVTEKRLRRKRIIKRTKVEKAQSSAASAAKYEKLLSQFVKERKASRKAEEKAAAAAKKATTATAK